MDVAAMRISPRQAVPCTMTLDRAWRWCIQATMRELRLARYGRRDIGWHNLRRMFMRRWADTCRLYDIADDGTERAELSELGLTILADGVSKLRGRIRQAA
jgi:hypothetical protein